MDTEFGVPDWFYELHEQLEAETQSVTEGDLLQFSERISKARDEAECQQAIEDNRWVFLQFMRTGHGNWVIPRPRLGTHFIPDFLWAEGNSSGLRWTGVELESPNKRPFIQSGSFSKYLNHAIDQVKDWRAYISPNCHALRAPPNQVTGGAGLHQIWPELRAQIIIGRRVAYPDRYQDRRRQLDEESRIEVMSYDTLVEGAVEMFYRPPRSWRLKPTAGLREEIARILRGAN